MACYGVYTVRDVKGEYCLPPFVARTDEIARRMIVETVDRNVGIPMAVYGEDFRLLRIAGWDEESGLMTPCDHIDLGDCRYILALAHKRVHVSASEIAGGESVDDKETPYD